MGARVVVLMHDRCRGMGGSRPWGGGAISTCPNWHSAGWPSHPRGTRVLVVTYASGPQSGHCFFSFCPARLRTLRYLPDSNPTRSAPAGTGRVTPAARLKSAPHSRTVFTLQAMRVLPSAATARQQLARPGAAKAETAAPGAAGMGGGAAREGAAPPKAAGKEDAVVAQDCGRLLGEDDGGAKQTASGAAEEQSSDGDQPSGGGAEQPPAPAPSPSLHVHVRLVTCSLDRSLVFTDLDFPPLQQPDQQQHAAVRQPTPVVSSAETDATAAGASVDASSPLTGAGASTTSTSITADINAAPSENPAPQPPAAPNQEVNSLAHLHTAAHANANPHGQGAAGRADDAWSWRRGPEPPAPAAPPSLLLPRGGSLWWRLTGLGGYAQSLDWTGMRGKVICTAAKDCFCVPGAHFYFRSQTQQGWHTLRLTPHLRESRFRRVG